MSSQYKNFLLKQLGIKESMKPSEIKPDAFSKMNGKDDEKRQEPTAREKMLSPTAVATPVLAIAVRGSNTGGLPSGKNMSPSKLGGYEPIETAKENSEVIDKTPQNAQINSLEPIANTPETSGDTHPHQVQNSTDEPPQAVTGASTEDDTSLKLKDIAPKELEVDVAEGEDEDNRKDNPEFQEKDAEQFRKDRANSPEGDEVRKSLGMNEDAKIPTHRLLAIRETFQEKALSGKMNKKESEIFRRITEVLQKRGHGLENKLFGKKSLSEIANVKTQEAIDPATAGFIGAAAGTIAYKAGKDLHKKLSTLKKQKSAEKANRDNKKNLDRLERDIRRDDLA